MGANDLHNGDALAPTPAGGSALQGRTAAAEQSFALPIPASAPQRGRESTVRFAQVS
jgi:hypothetical protein